VIAIVAMLGPGLINLYIAVTLVSWVLYARIVRGETLALKARPFVMSARGFGFSDFRIMFRPILPNAVAPAFVFGMSDFVLDVQLGATLSFFPTKNLGALGDGGALITERDDLAAQTRLLRAQGDAGSYKHTAIGTNARLDALQAAFLRTKLRHLPEWTAMRRASAARYRAALAGAPVTLPPDLAGAAHTYHQFTIRAPERDRLQTFLRDRGIATRVYYPIPLHLQPCFEPLGHRLGEFPVSERLAAEVLSLPIYPGITAEQIDRVAGAVREFYGKSEASA
jgi:hypothetical protein